MIQNAEVKTLVSVVIVNWIGKYLLPVCLDSVSDQSLRDIEVVLVDNGSQDGSAEYVRSHYPEVKVVSLPVNTGFAGGSNAAIRAASGKYIALLNNDTRTDRNLLASLLDAAPRWCPSRS